MSRGWRHLPLLRSKLCRTPPHRPAVVVGAGGGGTNCWRRARGCTCGHQEPEGAEATAPTGDGARRRRGGTTCRRRGGLQDSPWSGARGRTGRRADRRWWSGRGGRHQLSVAAGGPHLPPAGAGENRGHQTDRRWWSGWAWRKQMSVVGWWRHLPLAGKRNKPGSRTDRQWWSGRWRRHNLSAAGELQHSPPADVA